MQTDSPYFLSSGEAAARKTWEAVTAPPEATSVTSDWPDTNWGMGGGWGWHLTNSTAQYWLQSTTGKNNQVMMAAMFIAGLLDGCLVSARKLFYH